jgi:hypothetical protein
VNEDAEIPGDTDTVMSPSAALLRWQRLPAPEIERRLGIPRVPDGDPRALAVIAAALACLDVAVEPRRGSGGAADPAAVFDAAVAAVRS